MVWIGKNASRPERAGALELGQQYLNGTAQPDRPIVKLLDGGENEQFEAAFEVGVMSTARPGDGVSFSGGQNYGFAQFASTAAAAQAKAQLHKQTVGGARLRVQWSKQPTPPPPPDGDGAH